MVLKFDLRIWIFRSAFSARSAVKKFDKGEGDARSN
jgi:hypothetical protein